jgi:LCP family protein required for cell wall assembly
MNFRLSRAAIAAYALCSLLAIAAGYFAFRPSAQRLATEIASAPVHAVEQLFVPDPQELFGKPEVRVLLVGLDYDYDTTDQETSKQSRSDIIMALKLDFRHHHIAELSVPRDMIATLPNGKLAKINQAQSEGGIRESQSVVAQWLGIPAFDRYVVLRIDTAKDLVNAIGGVDVEVKNSDALRGTGKNGPIDYDDHWGHLAIHLKPGLQHLNGEQAVAYARFRHDWCSDPCRIMRQQQMIHAVLDKVEQNQWNTLAHAQQLIAVVRKDVDTNLTTQEQLSSVVAFARLSAKDVATAQVPYVRNVDLPDYGDSLVADETAKQRLVASMLTPSDDIASAAAGSVAAAGSIRVRVENGTSVAGLAGRVASDLRRRGFMIAEVRNAPSHDVTVTKIQSQRADLSASYRVRNALGPNAMAAAVVQAATPIAGDEADVTVVLGNDIVGGKP